MSLCILDKDGNKVEITPQTKLTFTTVIYGICEECGVEFHRQYRKRELVPLCSSCLKKKSFRKKAFLAVERRKQTNLKKYGVIHPMKNSLIKEKVKQTNLRKYGNPSSLHGSNQEKLDEVMIKKYGVKSVLSLKEIRSKIDYNKVAESVQNTNMLKYGVKSTLQLKNVKEKIKSTWLEKYQVDNPMKNRSIAQKAKQTRFKKEYLRLLETDRLKKLVEPLFDISEYKGVEFQYKWRCLNCGTIFEDNLDDGKIPRCPVCFPKQYQESKYEIEIADWLSSYTVVERRYKIDGKEIDIFLPEYNLGIEFDGLYWHSELTGNKDKNYHISKTRLAANYGIQLIHIFEDEWIEKQEIVRSIIKNKIGKTDAKMGARETQLIKIDSSTAQSFLEDNHIQGYAPSKYKFALIKKDDIVAVMTINKSRFKKDTWEITRFATKINTVVIGAFSKLLSAFNDKGNFVTYADLRYFTGKAYRDNGFIFSHFTKPDYYYTDYKHRYNRIQFQKHKLAEKLEYFEPALTEWQNMQLNGWDRIWGCGNAVYVREL